MRNSTSGKSANRSLSIHGRDSDRVAQLAAETQAFLKPNIGQMARIAMQVLPKPLKKPP